VLSVLAICSVAALLSHATESVAAKTGDTVGGLLNATLEPDRTGDRPYCLRAGQYMLVKASIAGAIVTTFCSCSAHRSSLEAQEPLAAFQ